MTLQEFLVLLTGITQFPKQMLSLIALLQNTPQENHQAIMDRISSEERNFEVTGRPKWEE